MHISLVILTCNQKKLTMRCLDSLRSFIDNPSCELILVDNGSQDGTAAAVNMKFPKVRIIRFDNNVGVAAGRNAGLRAATGQYLMILDNDTVADAYTIHALADYLHTHPDVGIVAPLLRSPEGRVQHSFKPFPGFHIKLRNVLNSRKRTSYVIEQPKETIEPFYLIGAAQMFPAAVYHNTDGLDENIFYGPEDADFCMAVRKQGKKIVYLPSLSIIHDWQRASTNNIFSKISRLHTKGLIYFYIKHKRLF